MGYNELGNEFSEDYEIIDVETGLPLPASPDLELPELTGTEDDEYEEDDYYEEEPVSGPDDDDYENEEEYEEAVISGDEYPENEDIELY